MKCKNESCHNEVRGNSVYCSDTCKTLYNRNKSRNNVAVTAVTVEPGNDFVTVPDCIVYKRPAVHYEGDTFRTRPKPLDPNDKPSSQSRGRYTRPDGTVYQFDCLGHVFEVVDGLVYQTIGEVQECYA